MDTKQLQQLLKHAGSVVILGDDGRPAAVAVDWGTWLRITGPQTSDEAPVEEIPISSRWPKAPRQQPAKSTGDQVLERLNKEILALKAQIEQEEASAVE